MGTAFDPSFTEATSNSRCTWLTPLLIPIEGAHQNEMIAPAVTE
jgi:hypothetical protein